MKSLRYALYAIGGALIVALMLTAQLALGAPVAQSGNLLQNPSFEGQVYDAYGGGTAIIPLGWEPFYRDTRPNYEMELHPPHVRTGTYSARFYTAYSVHDAGLLQQVQNVTPGATYRFSAWVLAWSTENPVVDTPSTSTMETLVGIDPNGGKDPWAASVVWGSNRTMDAFTQIVVEAKANASTITVFLRAKPDWPVARNDTFWDDAELIQTAGPAVTQTAPTQAPATTSPGTGGTLATPDATGRIVHTVVAGDTLSGLAFAYGVTVDEIKQLNGLTSNIIVVGQQLVIVAGSAAPTAVPTEEPAGSETPETTEGTPETAATPTPPPAPTEVAQAQPGMICLIAYADANSNGFRETDELLQGGINFTLSDGAQVVATYVTDGVNEPYCFEGLEPGTYIVSWTAEGFAATTDQTWAASVAGGATLNREFGLQPLGGEAPAADTSLVPEREGLPTWLIALIGALGIILLLAGIGAAVYFILMRRAKV
ncbi:MAG: hypothetical protein Kow00124_15240 [Anaerolineae bacterium]